MKKKQFSKEFKLEILQELESGKTVAQISSEHDLKHGLIWTWRREYNRDPQHAFAGHGKPVREEARNAALEQKIGQQTMEIDFLKRVNANLQTALVESKKKREVKNMIFQNIQTEKRGLTLSKACELLCITRHAYQSWLAPTPIKEDPLLAPVLAIKKDRDCRRYGYRRVTKELHRRGTPANHNKVLETMRKNGLTVKKKAFQICTTNSNHNYPVYPNRIRGLKVLTLNQVWAGDITYIQFANGQTAYLATLLDLCSRKALGWQLSLNIDTQLCLNAFQMAVADRKGYNLKGVIHHSDQGSQYAANEYVTEVESYGMLMSMSRRGNPYDNAYVESFNKTVKYEEVYMDEYASFEDAYQNIKHFIEEVYNKKRLHSSIGYIPPLEFEQQYKLKEVVA